MIRHWTCFQNCSSGRKFAPTFKMFTPTHFGFYRVLKEAHWDEVIWRNQNGHTLLLFAQC